VEAFIVCFRNRKKQSYATVDITTRKVVDEVVHYSMNYDANPQSAELYKVFGKNLEWMLWEENEHKDKFIPLGLTIR
jgi:hypothetical protein